MRSHAKIAVIVGENPASGPLQMAGTVRRTSTCDFFSSSGIHYAANNLPTVPASSFCLGNLVGMVDRDMVYTPAVDIQLVTQVFHRHRGALPVPPWETIPQGESHFIS